ncbi:hypothetical protein K505DRAFT_233714 [Melanomma pulvis-pyrius CBS 109.77]|uniref:Xylanolytic transcriptional activator regulatory domain-containing protein n=1 Tax=Melanomma pulvis-pyrius CBS 109.77 TaxID=1314802 RepID=A0A6A6XP69_9PLEO|nr:hypothetical protein K505DRAFT_233714 [Melanomma pulvis-pyrius CBS 109.77]
MNIAGSSLATSNNKVAFSVNVDRLIDLYYENFYGAFPITTPLHYVCRRKMSENHQLQDLLLVMQWVGSIYAPWTTSDPYYEKAHQALQKPTLPRNGFSVQALMIFAVAQHHSDLKLEARITLNLAIAIALELGMNSKEFAQRNGEGNPVLEESWRRTYYLLYLTDQHFSVVVNNPTFTLRDLPNLVDLPCDDEYYELGQIPPTRTWQDYESREFADDEVIYSSIVYLYDVASVVSYIMRSFLATGSFGDILLASVDAKIAAWKSLLPACKKDPLHQNGKVDEVMFLAHMISAILIMNTHRPFSTLTYSIEELTTESFVSAVPYVEPLKQGQGAHTARALKAADIQTKLLAIPCVIERHHPFTLCITASIATAQVSACNFLLEDHALSIARDRVRLSIGYLSAMGSHWPLAKKMAREVRRIARRTLAGPQSSLAADVDPNAEIEIPRDDLIWPVGDPASQIDIYSGLVLPMTWDMSLYESPTTSSIMS